MNYVTTALGVFAVGYGIYTAILRKKDPSKFIKLEAMKKVYGEKRGTLIHVVGYSVIPIVIGTFFIILGISGRGV